MDGVLGFVSYGACMVLDDYFNVKRAFELIEKHKCTVIHGVPTVFVRMLEHPDFSRYNLKSLRTGLIGGAPSSMKLIEGIVNRMGVKEITNIYGMTETSCPNTQTLIGDSTAVIAMTVGKPLPDVRVEILDCKTGKPLPPGNEGEICVSGHSVMMGYYKNPDLTKRIIDDAGRLHTGDLGMMIEDGYLKVTGRIKEMYITSGENVYPEEIEDFLHRHPKIEQCAVIGVPDPIRGEVGMAFVKLKSGELCTKENVLDFCTEGLAKYKIPKYVEFVEEFPLTQVGKIQRSELKKMATK
jgi:fatty-acyl-CoA synthase